LNPTWGRAHAMDFLVYHMEQHLFVDVYDSDLLSKDDLLGYVTGQDGQKRPRINDLDENEEEKLWDLHEGGKLKLICRFREVLEDKDFVEPLLVQCNQRCHEGLSKSKSLRACSLCGEGSMLKLMRCGSCLANNDPHFECPTCRFRCCGRCAVGRRPASAVLRICLREGVVPPEDAKTGVVLGVQVEGETQWSALSVRPTYEDATEQSEVKRWIHSLCSRFDRASVAKWLDLPAERIYEVLEEKTTSTEKVDFLGKEPVIFDHALHFLVRDPSAALNATVIYRGQRSKVECEVPLFKNTTGPAPCSEKPHEMFWPIPLEAPYSASVFVEVTMQGLAS